MREELRQSLLNLARPLHIKLRRSKIELFKRIARPADTAVTVLDVGGGLGIANEFQSLYEASSEFKVTLLNLTPLSFTVDGIRVASLAADACRLPFPDRVYDWVFSNAVIEHVGDLSRQAMFANEIRRVARRGYFVTTPNRRFPIEPHTLFPFYQFLSPRNQRIALKFSFGYVREWEDIHLLSRAELQGLFPEAEICGMGPPALATTLVAYHLS